MYLALDRTIGARIRRQMGMDQGRVFVSSAAPIDPELLRWWGEIMTVPCVAIGGITVENCGTLVEAGADFLAIVAGVWSHPAGPAAAVRAFNAEILRHSG